MTITEPGVYELTAADYHADPSEQPSLSSTVARLLIERSPLHAWRAHPRLNSDHERSTTPRLSLGDLCHKLLLGAGKGVAIYDGNDWRKKEAREFRDAAIAAGEIPATAPEYDRASKIVDAARQQLPDVGSPVPERTWIAEEFGAYLRAMTDWWDQGTATVLDYKTTAGSAHPDAVAKAAANLGYDFQQAFYERVVANVRPDLAGRIRFRFIFQEIDPPWALSVVELNEAALEVARRKVDAAVARWSECMASDEWPGYGKRVHRVVLPDWHDRAWLERELEEEDAA